MFLAIRTSLETEDADLVYPAQTPNEWLCDGHYSKLRLGSSTVFDGGIVEQLQMGDA